MSEPTPYRLVEPAKNFLLELFADGKKRTIHDLNVEILGIEVGSTYAAFLSTAINTTIFSQALRQLVVEGKVEEENDLYWMEVKAVEEDEYILYTPPVSPPDGKIFKTGDRVLLRRDGIEETGEIRKFYPSFFPFYEVQVDNREIDFYFTDMVFQLQNKPQ